MLRNLIVALTLLFAIPAMAQLPSPTFDNMTVLGTASMQGGMNVSAPYTAPGMTATVKVERSSSSGFPSTWTAYDALNNPIAACSSGPTTCFQDAVNLAFPYASGTTAYGYDLKIYGGNDPAKNEGHNFGGGAAEVALTAPLQFPAIQGGSVQIGAITLEGTSNDSVIFDSCEMCDINFEGAQLVFHNFGGNSYALRFKPTEPTPLDGGIGDGPMRVTGSSLVGRFRYDLSGIGSVGIVNDDVHIYEINLFSLGTGCGVQLDSPAAGQNDGLHHIVIEQLHGIGSAGTSFCNGTTTPASGQMLGQSYFNLGIATDGTAGTENGFDEWGSGDEIHLRLTGFSVSSGYSLKFESGACRNTVFISSDQASPTITDSSGCIGANANAWWVGGVLYVAGVAQQTIPQTLTAHGVLIGEGASAPTVATIGTGGRAMVDQGSGADPQFKAFSGDVSLAASGSTTVSNLSNVSNASLGTSAIAAAAVTNAKLANPSATVASVSCTLGSTCALNATCASLSADVPLSTSNTFFDGPSINMGTSGTFLVWGTAAFSDTAATGTFDMKVYDGTNNGVINLRQTTGVASTVMSVGGAGIMTNPAGNIRVAGRNPGDNTSTMKANAFGSSNATTTVCALRLQ